MTRGRFPIRFGSGTGDGWVVVAALTAIATAFWPPALLLALLVGVVSIVGVPLLGDFGSAIRIAAVAV